MTFSKSRKAVAVEKMDHHLHYGVNLERNAGPKFAKGDPY